MKRMSTRTSLAGAMPLLLFSLSIGPWVGGCGAKACSTAGCADQFRAGVSITSGAAAFGTYIIDVTAEGAALSSCTLVLTPEALAGDRLVSGECPPGIEVLVGPALTCTTTATDAVRTQTCDPVSGPLVEFITLAGTPASVHVTQSLDGALVLDQTVMPIYQVIQPNGPGCAPTCREGGASWTIP